jgi:hypothetical protein
MKQAFEPNTTEHLRSNCPIPWADDGIRTRDPSPWQGYGSRPEGSRVVLSRSILAAQRQYAGRCGTLREPSRRGKCDPDRDPTWGRSFRLVTQTCASNLGIDAHRAPVHPSGGDRPGLILRAEKRDILTLLLRGKSSLCEHSPTGRASPGSADSGETSVRARPAPPIGLDAGLARAAGRTYASMPQRCSVVIVRGAAPTGTMKVPTTTASVSGSSFLTSIDASGPISKNVSPAP